MKRVLALALTLAAPALAQEGAAPPEAPANVTLQVGLAVPLTLLDTLSTEHTPKGTEVHLAVSEDIVADGIVAIPAGTQAFGEVTRSDAKGAFGKSGKLEARVLYIVLNGRPVRLSGVLSARGKSGTTATVVTVVLAGTLGWAVTGKSAVLEKGVQLTAVLDRPVTIARPGPS